MSIPESTPPSPSHTELLDHISTAVRQLKNQHSALAKTFPTYPGTIDTTSLSNLAGPHLPTTAEEDDEVHTPSTVTTGRNRQSIFSSHSGDGSIWFDAPEYDGPEEYLLDLAPPEDAQDKVMSTDSRLTERTDMTDVTDGGSSTGLETDSESEEETPKLVTEEPAVVQRRTALPSGPVGDEGSLFGVLKKNVGKVGGFDDKGLCRTLMNELGLIEGGIARHFQRASHDATEDCRRARILRPSFSSCAGYGPRSADVLCRRICSLYVCEYPAPYRSKGLVSDVILLRSACLPDPRSSNPLLAETFEDPRMHFIAEKVCHNPVILAWHAEGEGWELYATSSGKTKFWGKIFGVVSFAGDGPSFICREEYGGDTTRDNPPQPRGRTVRVVRI